MDWTDEPYSDRRLSPRACLNRQAGFTAARPVANGIPPSAAGWRTPRHNLEASGRPSAARKGVEDIPRGADCGLEGWSGCFRLCVARKIGRAKRGCAREGDRGARVRTHCVRASDRVQIPHLPAKRPVPEAERCSAESINWPRCPLATGRSREGELPELKPSMFCSPCSPNKQRECTGKCRQFNGFGLVQAGSGPGGQ